MEPSSKTDIDILHSIYMPFTEKQLKIHFAEIKVNGVCEDTADKHIKQYSESIKAYAKFWAENTRQDSLAISKLKKPCQIEKDEKFWTASTLMTVYHSENRIEQFSRLLEKAYGTTPQGIEIGSWEECLDGDLHLFFEPNLPSPQVYKDWLRESLPKRQMIPYKCWRVGPQ